ncbi:hypothetical protein Bca4012_067812 [Brassica carinata]
MEEKDKNGSGLVFAIHLITAAALSCQKRKGKVVKVEDVQRVYPLFLDVRRSMQYFVDYQGQYIFSEVPSQSD